MRRPRRIASYFLLFAFALVGCISGNASFPTASSWEQQQVSAFLRLPDGPGPHPAIVLLHGCGGLERERPGQFVWRGLNLHADALLEIGIATLIVDSWGSRGLYFDELMRTNCRWGAAGIRVDDLYGAIDYLNGLPAIDGARIGAVGLSEGGRAVLRALQTDHYRNRPHRLAASVAFYPPCYGLAPPFYAPSLILIGDADDITPSQPCLSLVHVAELATGNTVFSVDMPREAPLVHVYAGVHHSFDLPFSGMHQIPIGTVAASPEATHDARARMVEFFRKYLLP